MDGSSVFPSLNCPHLASIHDMIVLLPMAVWTDLPISFRHHQANAS